MSPPGRHLLSTLLRKLPLIMFLFGCNASANDGIAMTNISRQVRLDVSKKYSFSEVFVTAMITAIIDSSTDISVFIRNSVLDC